MNELLTYALMLDSPVVAYIQLVIMLIELKKVLSQEGECIYAPLVHMSTNGMVIHCMEQGQSPNPRKIHRFKWEFCVQCAFFFQECNAGVKQGLPECIEL